MALQNTTLHTQHGSVLIHLSFFLSICSSLLLNPPDFHKGKIASNESAEDQRSVVLVRVKEIVGATRELWLNDPSIDCFCTFHFYITQSELYCYKSRTSGSIASDYLITPTIRSRSLGTGLHRRDCSLLQAFLSYLGPLGRVDRPLDLLDHIIAIAVHVAFATHMFAIPKLVSSAADQVNHVLTAKPEMLVAIG